MTQHDWKFISLRRPPKSKGGNLNSYIIPKMNLPPPGVYICTRCGDEAIVNIDDKPYSPSEEDCNFVTMNWNSDCDEVILRKVHES